MKNTTLLILLVAFFASCANKTNETPNDKKNLPIEGSWLLINAKNITGKDTTFTDYTKNIKGVKYINKTHFSFFQHDLNKGKDSTNVVFVSGGGKYELDGTKYTEHLEFINYREWEENTFHFEVEIVGDTLIQKGIEKIEDLGVDRIIIEKYVRIK